MRYSLFGELLFSAFVIFETNRGELDRNYEKTSLVPTTTLLLACCIELELDIINLFLYVLSILVKAL